MLNAWLCEDSAEGFVAGCEEIVEACPSACWDYDNATEICSPPAGAVNLTCAEDAIYMELDTCLIPENFQHWSTAGMDKRLTCGGRYDAVSRSWTFSEATACNFEMISDEEFIHFMFNVTAFENTLDETDSVILTFLCILYFCSYKYFYIPTGLLNNYVLQFLCKKFDHLNDFLYDVIHII